jgi:hypothetical protein
MDDRKRAEITIAVERSVRDLVKEAGGDENDVLSVFGVALAAVLGPMSATSSGAEKRALIERVVNEMLGVFERNIKAA